MTTDHLILILEIALIAYGLVSGVFLAFSGFVMKSLGAAQPAGGIESMQIINIKVMPTIFMVLLIGMSFLSPAFIYYANTNLTGLVANLIMAGAAIFFIGTFIVSLIFNIPMNEKLAKMDYSADETATYWKHYVKRWTFWNSVRTWSSAIAAICFLLAVIELAKA